MRINIILFSFVLILTALLTGCPSGEQPKPNANVNAPKTNSNATAPNSNAGSLTTVAKTPEPTTNQAPTLAPIFKSYCDAMTRKDEAAVRKLYAASALKTYEADMKEEKETSLVKYLSTDGVSNKLCEVTNEAIKGDEGVAIVKTAGAPNGVRYKFVKEGGEWKLTGPDFGAMQK